MELHSVDCQHPKLLRQLCKILHMLCKCHAGQQSTNLFAAIHAAAVSNLMLKWSQENEAIQPMVKFYCCYYAAYCMFTG